MGNIPDQAGVIGVAALVIVGLVLTPIFGAWGWISIALGIWMTWKCLTAIGRS